MEEDLAKTEVRSIVNEAVESLGKEISILSDLVGSVVARIKPLCRSIPEKVSNDKPQEQTAIRSPLVTDLEKEIIMVKHISNRLNQVLAELDI